MNETTQTVNKKRRKKKHDIFCANCRQHLADLDGRKYSVREVSTRFGISPAKIRRELESGSLEGYLFGSDIRFTERDLQEYERNCRIDNTNIDELKKECPHIDWEKRI